MKYFFILWFLVWPVLVPAEEEELRLCPPDKLLDCFDALVESGIYYHQYESRNCPVSINLDAPLVFFVAECDTKKNPKTRQLYVPAGCRVYFQVTDYEPVIIKARYCPFFVTETKIRIEGFI